MEFVLYRFQGTDSVLAQVSYSEGRIQLRYLIESPDIKWPAVGQLNRADDLWRTTCFECFLGHADGSGYVEINLSPSGQWNSYHFDDYRAGMRLADEITVTDIGGAYPELTATVNFPALTEAGDLLLGLSAVLENRNGERAYYAIGHGQNPDFHDATQHVLVGINDL